MSSLKLTSFTPLNGDTKKKVIFIWKSIYDSNDSLQFRNPVDWKALGLLDYLKYVQKPMDLNTINKKLRQEKYKTVQNVLDDLQLIFDNCKIYNIPGSWIYNLAQKIQSSFLKMIRNCIPRIIDLNPKSKVNPNYIKQKQAQQLIVPQIVQDQHNFYIEQVSYNDKIKFTDKLSHISSQNLQNILKKIINKCPNVITLIKPQDQPKQQIGQKNKNIIFNSQSNSNIINRQNIVSQINTQNNNNPEQNIEIEKINQNVQNKSCNNQIVDEKKQQKMQIQQSSHDNQVQQLQLKLQQQQIQQNKQQNKQQQIIIQQQKPRRGRRGRTSNNNLNNLNNLKQSKQSKLTNSNNKQLLNQNNKLLDKMQIGQKLQICIDDLNIQNFQQLMKLIQGMVQEKDKVMKKIKLD